MESHEARSELNYDTVVIIPAYNERDRIRDVLDEAAEYISTHSLPWRIVVSIDGDDDTDEIVDAYAKVYPFISHVKGSGRSGKGNAIRRAAPATSKYVVTMDADGSIAFGEIVRTIKLLQDHDAVILSRYSPDNAIPFLRRSLSRGFNALVQAFTGLRVKDTQSGYKIFRTEIFRKAIANVGVSNTFYDISLLWHIKKAGGRIVEIPTKYEHRNGSKFHPIGEVIGQGTSLLAFVIRHSRFFRYVPRPLIDLYYRKFRWI
ncbi:glycosyltransferase [Thermoplasmatales archaeon AK]|nr:glycosyltransferase [Thermoplasmatales archaeon AK]